MPNFSLPRDSVGHALQAIAPGTPVNGTVGATTANVALPSGAEAVRVACVNDCYIAFGTSGVTASGSSIFMPRGSEIFEVPSGATHIAFIQHTTGGVISIAAAT